jgi:hypothetical protein
MSDIDLQHRMTTSVETVDAPSDLVDRVRQGGARRLRRRRFIAAAAVALSAVVVADVATAGPSVMGGRDDTTAAAVPATDDPYRFLLNQPTRGDLANDQIYLDQVVSTWDESHEKSLNQDRGIFDNLRGNPHVAWAGRTPGGRAAIVVQQSYLRKHDNLQIAKGLYTLIGFIGEDADGHSTLIADSYPAPGAGLITGFVTGSRQRALVMLDTGQKVGWSSKRIYADDGSSHLDYAPLKFTDGISVVPLRAGTDVRTIMVSVLPAGKFTHLFVAGTNWPDTSTRESRLWPTAASWPLGPGAEEMRNSAADLFGKTLDDVTAQYPLLAIDSLWHAYGKTANGSRLVVGEFAMDTDATRVYAVLQSPTGKTEVVPGGIPDPSAPLPVTIRLPNDQGWVVARRGARLSSRVGDGAWSTPRENAALVAENPKTEAKVEVAGSVQIVQLR